MENPLLHWLLAINLVVFTEVDVFLSPKEKSSTVFVFHTLYNFIVAVGVLGNWMGSIFWGGRTAVGSKVMLCQGLSPENCS